MSLSYAFRCSRCGADFEPAAAARYACDRCHAEALDVELDLKALTLTPTELASRRERSLWRYRELLPVGEPPADSGPLLDAGGTPLYRAPRAAARAGAAEVWIKDDGRLPTGSLKDRASAVVAVRALELGVDRVITASTGNAGVAIAAMARAAGLTPVVLVPASAPAAKVAQLLVFGAELYLVAGNYDEAFALSRQAAAELGWYCRNTAMNPFTIEGKKTAAFEICEQLGWRAPDRIYVSVGDGNIISGIHKGLRDLLALGWIDSLPKLVGVQAAGSAAIARAFAKGADAIEPVEARTLADSIAADMPADGLRALRAVRDSGGEFVTVDDQAILDAIVTLAHDTTVFAEPAAAAAYAGLIQHAQAAGIAPGERIVVLVTGNGLKDVASAARAVAKAPTVEPRLDDLLRAIQERQRST